MPAIVKLDCEFAVADASKDHEQMLAKIELILWCPWVGCAHFWPKNIKLYSNDKTGYM